MNDRFKFRVWNKATEKFVERFILSPDDGICIISDKGKTYVKGNPNYILMQSTGLHDKNGNLIYEGDIVEAKHKPDREGWYCVWRGVVQYDNQNCQYVLKASHYSVLNETKLNKATFENNESFNWFDWLEVIGNIYENKELLNE